MVDTLGVRPATWTFPLTAHAPRKSSIERQSDIYAMTYGSECWAGKKKDENKQNSAEMRMLRWARGEIRLDHIRNEEIGKEAHVKSVKVSWKTKD